jgi:hypothetical protein
VLSLRCGCASWRGRFTPDLPSEGLSPALPERLSVFSAATAAATSSSKPFRPNPRLQPQPHRLHFRTPLRTSFWCAAHPMWLRLQARTIHTRLPRRRPFPSPSRKTFRILRGYSRSHTCCDFERLPARASGVLRVPCGCACRRGRFTPVFPAEGPYPAIPKRLSASSAATAAATSSTKSFRTDPRLQPRPHLLSFATPLRTSFCCAAPPMWLRLQARTIHDRPPRRRHFPDYSRKSFRPSPRLQPQPHRTAHTPHLKSWYRTAWRDPAHGP